MTLYGAPWSSAYVMPRLIAGWTVAYCLLWLCWVLAAPVIAESVRHQAKPQHLCPMIQVRHGIGPNLKTYAKGVDLCSTSR